MKLASLPDSTPEQERSYFARVLNKFAGLVIDYSTVLYSFLVVSSLLAFLAAAYFLTVEADEAWILLSTFNAFGVPLPPTDALASPTLTSGGVHLLLHGTLAWVSSSMFAHRLISLAFTLVLLTTVYLLIKRSERSTAVALAGVTLFLAVPGFIFQAGLATAEIIATSLLIIACAHWLARGQWSARAAVVSGTLLGLSCATRINCAVAIPAFVIFSALAGRDNWSRFYRPVICVVVTISILFVAMAAYVLLTTSGQAEKTTQFFLESSGVSGGKSFSQLVWAFSISNRIMPTWLVALIATVCVISLSERTPNEPQSQETRLTVLLVVIGGVGLLAWIDKAPIPHVRYLWPALPCLWLAGVLQLTRWLSEQSTPMRSLPLHALIFAACISRLAEDLLIIANGESLTLVYQANGIASADFPGIAFHAAKDQRAAAQFVNQQPSDASFFTPIPPVAFPITLLSGRVIGSINQMPMRGNRYLVWSPADSNVWHPDAVFVQWIRNNTTPVMVSGEFAVLRVHDGNDAPPPALMQRGGRNSILPAAYR